MWTISGTSGWWTVSNSKSNSTFVPVSAAGISLEAPNFPNLSGLQASHVEHNPNVIDPQPSLVQTSSGSMGSVNKSSPSTPLVVNGVNKPIGIPKSEKMTTALVIVFSKYLIAKEVAIASLTCRSWRYCVTNNLYWDLTWKKAYPGFRQFGHKILGLLPERSVENMKTIQSEIHQIKLDTIEALGGQKEIDSFPLFIHGPGQKTIYDLVKLGFLQLVPIVRFKQANAIRVVIVKISAVDKEVYTNRGIDPKVFDKTLQIIEKLNSIWETKAKLVEEYPTMCDMQLLDCGTCCYSLNLPQIESSEKVSEKEST